MCHTNVEELDSRLNIDFLLPDVCVQGSGEPGALQKERCSDEETEQRVLLSMDGHALSTLPR